jgi:hypothetical protein
MYFPSSTSLQGFDGFSVATPKDGVHWEPAGTPIRTPRGIQTEGSNHNLPAFADGRIDMQQGTILEGKVIFPADAEESNPGICFETTAGEYHAIRFLSYSVTVAGKIKADGTGFEPVQKVNRDLRSRKKAKFRLLARQDIIELYLDDILFNVYSLPLSANARIGFLDSAEGIGKIKGWMMTLTDQQLDIFQ